jgi:hypothetical protein
MTALQRKYNYRENPFHGELMRDKVGDTPEFVLVVLFFLQ